MVNFTNNRLITFKLDRQIFINLKFFHDIIITISIFKQYTHLKHYLISFGSVNTPVRGLFKGS